MLPVRLLLCLASLALLVPLRATTISLFNSAVTEDFNTLATTSTSSALPAGWSFSETGSSADSTYAAGTGSGTGGNTYSFGVSGSTDRALGSLRSSAVVSTFGTMITNNTGDLITDLLVQYTGEQWRLGALGRLDRLDVSYSLDATSLTTGTWLEWNELDFVAPVTSGATGALNGTLEANQTTVSATLTGLALVPGATLWIRWSDYAASGSNDGLAIDDVSITAVQAGVPTVPDGVGLPVVALAFLGVLAAARHHRPAPASTH